MMALLGVACALALITIWRLGPILESGAPPFTSTGAPDRVELIETDNGVSVVLASGFMCKRDHWLWGEAQFRALRAHTTTEALWIRDPTPRGSRAGDTCSRVTVWIERPADPLAEIDVDALHTSQFGWPLRTRLWTGILQPEG